MYEDDVLFYQHSYEPWGLDVDQPDPPQLPEKKVKLAWYSPATGCVRQESHGYSYYQFSSFCFFSVVRDLGVTLDQELTVVLHIHTLLARSVVLATLNCANFRTVALSLTLTAIATLAHSFVTSRLDFCSFAMLASRLPD